MHLRLPAAIACLLAAAMSCAAFAQARLEAAASDAPSSPSPATAAGDTDNAPPPADAAAGIVDMDTVVVSGRLPGPGMWKVTRGGHVLYILGTLSPLPRRMEWVSDDVEATIARSQAVVDPPAVKLDADVGFFRGLALLPSLLKARRNPDGRSLQQVLPPELYARWTTLKERYIGRDGGVEKWRPVFAAQKLYESAIDKVGLSQKDIVQRVVRRAAGKHDVPRLDTTVEVKIEDPKGALKSFRETALADTDCFARTMVRIEHDLDGMRTRANAWAVGDVAALRDASFDSQYAACTRAFTQNALAERFGLGNLRARIAEKWLSTARKAIADNPVSFATLPIPLLIRPDGFLARLRKEGYTVEEPASQTAATADDTSELP